MRSRKFGHLHPLLLLAWAILAGDALAQGDPPQKQAALPVGSPTISITSPVNGARVGPSVNVVVN